MDLRKSSKNRSGLIGHSAIQRSSESAPNATQISPSDYLLKLQAAEDVRHLVRKQVATGKRLIEDSIVNTLAAYIDGWRSSSDDVAGHLALLLDVLGLGRLELEHAGRVAGIARLIGSAAGFGGRDIESIELASSLHDIGKAWIPRSILMSQTELNKSEWSIIKAHSELGWDLLNRVGGVEQEAAIVYSHHEWFDGGGYPRGLLRDQIPIGARIVAIADTIDAMTSDRSYRRGQTIGIARDEISRQSGAQFDPELVRCLGCIPDESIAALRRDFVDVTLYTA